MSPLVSIIIPVYNAAKYLDQTIQSVLDQTYINWELILINDGSPDNSNEVISKYLSNPKLKYFEKQNGGVSTARNLGIAHAQGKYIAFLDADDAWLPLNLELKINCLQENNLDWVFSDMLQADENLENQSLAPVGQSENFLDNILAWQGEVIPGPASNLIVKTTCFKEGLKFDPTFSTAADQDFTLCLSEKYKGARIPEALWVYRVLPGSMSKNIAVMERDHIGVFKKAAKNKLFKSFWFKQKCFANLYFILAGSWWVNASNKKRGIYFMILALINYPPLLTRLFKKIIL